MIQNTKDAFEDQFTQLPPAQSGFRLGPAEQSFG